MPHPRATRLSVCVIALAVALTCSTTARAEAEDSVAVEKATKLNKKAVDEYQNLNFEESRKLLKNAIDVCNQSGLDNHPVTARTYIHLGIVMFAGFKQKDEAIKHFRKALEIQADIKLDKILATPEVQEVYDEALEQHKADSAPKTPPPPPKPGEGIDHEPVAESPQGAAITIKAGVDPGVGAKKVLLSFSADGADDFAEREMKEDPPGSNTYVAEIPASATQGGVVDYFIEVLGDGDNPVATKGSQNKTMKIAMLGPNGQRLVPALRKTTKPPKKPAASSDESPSLFFGLGVGTGVGYASGTGEVHSTHVVDPAGLAMSRLVHFTPEVGYYLSPTLMLSVQLRYQLISGANEWHSPNDPTECGDGVCSPGTYAFAGFGRLNYFFGEGDLRTYVAGIGGLGTLRHVAAFESFIDFGPMRNKICVDTVASGPVFLGAGAGIMYNLSPAFALTLGTNALVGFTKFTFHADLNAGVAFEY
jgi:hypothetical protein